MKAEEEGVQFAQTVGASSLKDLRAMPAEDLLKAAWEKDPFRFKADVDGVFLPANLARSMAKGTTSPCPLASGVERR